MEKKKKVTDNTNVSSNIKNEETLLKEDLENDKWYTVEEAIQFVENNVREIYKANGRL